VKQNVKSALVIVTIASLLTLAVSSSGCTVPIQTQMITTWHSTGAPLKPGGLTVTGVITHDDGSGTGTQIPFDHAVQVNLTGDSDLRTSDHVKVLQQTMTDDQGKFTFTINARDDKWLLYAVVFELSGYQSQVSLVGGYLGMSYGIALLGKQMAMVPNSALGVKDKVTILSQLASVQKQVLKGQYSGAATTMDAVLAKMDAANATHTSPALVNATYTTYLLAKDTHWLSGEQWAWPDRSAPDNWKPY
jgi:hypothetical protein